MVHALQCAINAWIRWIKKKGGGQLLTIAAKHGTGINDGGVSIEGVGNSQHRVVVDAWKVELAGWHVCHYRPHRRSEGYAA